VTRATRKNGEFIYTITRQGDGTVPVAYAELPGARTYYTKVAHSDLARDAVVAQAIAEVLRTGATTRLDGKWSDNGKAEARISDTQLRRTHTEKVDFTHMEPEARQVFLRNLNDPPQLKLSVPGTKPAVRVKAPAKVQTASKTSRAASKTKSGGAKAATRQKSLRAKRKAGKAVPARKAAGGRTGGGNASLLRKPPRPANAATRQTLLRAKRKVGKAVPARKAAGGSTGGGKASLRKPRAAPRVARPTRRRPRKRVTSRR
jgi:hypothetical protein